MLLSKLGLIAVLVFLGLAAGFSWAVGSNQSEQVAGAKPVAAVATAKVTNDNTKTTSEPAHVRGFVEDQAGRPVAGAEVLVDAFTSRDTRGVTGADGSFAVPIRHPPYGWAVLVRAPSDHRRGFQRYDFNPTELNVPPRIVLKPSHEVVVRVTDAHQAPIAGASVEAAWDFSVLDDATTGPDGSVKLYLPVDAKVAWVVALKSGTGFDYAEFGVMNVHGGTDEAIPAREVPYAVALTFDGKWIARIKAVDRTDNPLAGVTFYPWTLHKEGRRSYVNVDSQIFNATTGPDGVVTFDWLPPNDGLMTFWPNAEGFAHRRVELNERETGLVTAMLSRTGAIRGRIVAPDGSRAPGIEVRALGSGKGMDHSHSQARSTADGSYEMAVGPGEAYAVYIDDIDWAAPSRLDVIVREGKPAEGVDFKLTRGTLVRGTVTVGPGNRPVANQLVGLEEAGGLASVELVEEGDSLRHDTRRYVHGTTDAEGRYSIRVGPGEYTLNGPPRTTVEELTVKHEPEIVRDFRMPRAQKGLLTGRVVAAGDMGVAGAKVEIAAADGYSSPFIVTADAEGRFRADRLLDRLLLCAHSTDGKLGGFVEIGEEAPEVTIAVGPTATATRRLLDEKGQPARNVKLEWGRRIDLNDDMRIATMPAPKVVTDRDGRFTLPELVVGQEYKILLHKDPFFYNAGAVRPQKGGTIDLGTLRAR